MISWGILVLISGFSFCASSIPVVFPPFAKGESEAAEIRDFDSKFPNQRSIADSRVAAPRLHLVWNSSTWVSACARD